jgi:superfamily II DNA or RNA helicase
MEPLPQPGSVLQVRSARWKVLATELTGRGYRIVRCRGLSGITKRKESQFIWDIETGSKVLDPARIELVPDTSSGLTDTKLYLEAAFRNTPTTSRKPMALGRAAIDDLKFQYLPVQMALGQDRVRLLIADDVGLGKTLEAGLITSELILRGRANRILVVTTRAMLTQFQKEFWTRFSIPLARLDSAAIQRMRNRIPAHYNVFDQFDRSIISIDTLKKDGAIRAAIEGSYWDLIIIDEAHNAANRARSTGNTADRAKLARLLSRRTDSLLLLTATPHDGSQESFASLVAMLDPTRVPDPSRLNRDDIADLIVRRFRFSPEVIADLRNTVPQRKLVRRNFPLSPAEERAYQSIAELRLDLDEKVTKGKAIDLFRTTLAKSIFSSPMACAETLDRRIRGIEQGTSSGTPADLGRLRSLADEVRAVDASAFSKYQDFLRFIRDLKWTGKDPRDRLVIFSERIATVAWLADRLKIDLGLTDDQVARVDGGSVEADVRTQKVIEDFGQKVSPIRVLIASDMASEGLNLHFQCHRLIHFDLPWSLLRFQQRNGRIDRYGQDRAPLITYFVAESSHPKVRQMWVLEKLVEKDEAAQQGVGDPAVFLGAGDVDGEEAVVAEAVAAGKGETAFGAEMDGRAADVKRHMSLNDEYAALFGEYAGASVAMAKPAQETDAPPPRLFPDTFSYAAAMLQRLSLPEEGLFEKAPTINAKGREIRLIIPGDMLSRDSLGYASEGAVDERYMPEEAVAPGGVVELTDNPAVINGAITRARMEALTWPTAQYLWDGHPILGWFADRSETFFPDHAAPVASLTGRLARGEVAVVLHGAIPNANGAPVVDRWAVVVSEPGKQLRIEEVMHFLARAGLAADIPNQGKPDLDLAREVVAKAVDRFQTHLVELRKARDTEIRADLNKVSTRLAEFRARFTQQLTLSFGDEPANESTLSGLEKRRLTLRREKEKLVSHLFDDWKNWFARTRQMVEDPNPHVDVKAVFVG